MIKQPSGFRKITGFWSMGANMGYDHPEDLFWAIQYVGDEARLESVRYLRALLESDESDEAICMMWGETETMIPYPTSGARPFTRTILDLFENPQSAVEPPHMRGSPQL